MGWRLVGGVEIGACINSEECRTYPRLRASPFTPVRRPRESIMLKELSHCHRCISAMDFGGEEEGEGQDRKGAAGDSGRRDQIVDPTVAPARLAVRHSSDPSQCTYCTDVLRQHHACYIVYRQCLSMITEPLNLCQSVSGGHSSASRLVLNR